MRKPANGANIAYSYGVDKGDNWGCEVSRAAGIAVHHYDCFTPPRPVCNGGRIVFHDDCVAVDDIASQNRHAKRNVLIKMDVGGREWDALKSVPDEVLARISQMAVEFHGTDERKFVQVIRRLKRHFYLVNVHFNNQTCTAHAAPLPAFAFQVLMVNEQIGVLDADRPSPAPMSALNAPNAPHLPDCQLAASVR